MNLRNLISEDIKDNHITFCFGRMNPPTIGHKQVFDTMKSVGGDYLIFLSHSQDPKKNPLDYDTKIDFIRKIHSEHADKVVHNSNLRTPWQVASYLYDLGYRHATFVGGDERKKMYEQLKQFNGVEGKPHGFYDFETFDFESSGAREDDAQGLAGISATKARADAENNDLEKFAEHTGAGEHAEELFNAVRKGMGITEEEPEKVTESDLIVSRSSLIEYIKDAVMDYIETENNIENLSKLLKQITGRSIVDSDGKKFRITKEDIRLALSGLKENQNKNKTNPVAKNMEKFNKPKTYKDRKKESDRGYEKHKGTNMKIEHITESSDNLVAELGRILMQAAKKADPEDSGDLSTLGSELTKYGTVDGAENMGKLADKVAMPLDQINAYLNMAMELYKKHGPVRTGHDTVDDDNGDEFEEGIGGALAGAAAGDSVLGKIGGAIVGHKTQAAIDKNDENIKKLAKALQRAGIDVDIEEDIETEGAKKKMHPREKIAKRFEKIAGYSLDDREKEYQAILDRYKKEREQEQSEAVNAPGASASRHGGNVLSALQRIVDDKSAQAVNFQDGKGKVDMFTASAIMQVYDAVNDDNKSKMKDALSTKAGFMKMAKFAMSKVGTNEGVFDKDGMLGKFVKRDTGTDVTTGKPNAPTFMGVNVSTRDKKIDGLKKLLKVAQQNSGKPGSGWKPGAPTIKDVPRLQAELAKLEKEAAMQVESVEEDSKFDRNFSKRVGYTVKGGAAADMMKKQADQTKQQNKDLDPGADKKGLGIGVLDTAKARKKAKEKGVRAPGSLRASPNTRNPNRLPESCSDCGKPRFVSLPEEIQAKYESINEAKQKGVDGKVCWKGYKRMGTKKKGGKTVDNCVKMSAAEKNK